MSEDIKVTVSLSTTPKRINSILPTIISLLNQTRSPDNIILCLPFYCPRLNIHLKNIPAYLLELERNTQLKILKTEDYGPATKFLPTWRLISREIKNHFLIWLDDDINYANTLVEELVANCPKRAAISPTGFSLLPSHHKIVLKHLQQADIVEGWGGVCCRVSDIPDLDKYWDLKPYNSMSFLEKCHWHSDDYVMSRALQDNGIQTVVCNTLKLNRYMSRPYNFGLQTDALQNSETTGGHMSAYAALEQERIKTKKL